MATRIHTNYSGPPWYQFNGHLQTILPAFGGPKIPYERKRLELEDGDFIDIDWLQQTSQSKQLIILTHGLEGNSSRPYIRSAAQFFHQKGWDILAWNCRSCSGEMNRLLRLYHHGEIGDIDKVIQYAQAQGDYQQIVLIGYSMGGAITSKYLGVHGSNVSPAILGGIAFSSPFDLEASVDALELPGNSIYKKRFLKQLGNKVRIKSERFPGIIDIEKLKDVSRWRDFDEWFTAPLLGLQSAKEFYALASANNFLEGLQKPVLAVCASNDPIITSSCMPKPQTDHHSFLKIETTTKGGHVGYALQNKQHNWMDERAWVEIKKWIDESYV